MEALQSTLDAYSEKQENEGEIFAKQQRAGIFESFRRNRDFYKSESRRECNTRITRADEQVVSVVTLIEDYDYQDINGSRTIETLNVNPSTGEMIGIRDVIRRPEALPAILEEIFALQGDPEKLYSSVSEEIQQMMGEDRLCFSVGMEGVSFYFPYGILQEYAILTLYYDEYPELFVEGIPFEGNYCTQVASYLDCEYFEDGRRVCLGKLIIRPTENNSLVFYRENRSDICLSEDFKGDIENSVYLVRTNGRHFIYVYSLFNSDDFRAFVYNSDGVMEETEVDPAVIPYIMNPIDPSSIELEAYVHPEHTIYDMYLDGDCSVWYATYDVTYESIYFDPEEEERHAFIDLNGDGIDEMYIESAAHSWPYSFYSVRDGRMYCIQPEEHEAAGADGAEESVLVLNDGRVVVTGNGADGRESCEVYRYNGSYQLELETTYTHVRNDPDRPGEDICTRYTEGSEEEITLQEYQSAVEELLSQAIDMPFVESSGD